MPTLKLTKPAERPLASMQLRSEMADALGVAAPYVDVHDDRVEVVGDVEDGMRAAAQAVLDAHVPAPVPPSLDDRLAEVESELRGMKERAAAASVSNSDAAKVRDAITGKA